MKEAGEKMTNKEKEELLRVFNDFVKTESDMRILLRHEAIEAIKQAKTKVNTYNEYCEQLRQKKEAG